MDNYKLFLERKSIKDGNFLGYKAPFDESNPIVVIESNGIHIFFDESKLINEYNKEIVTPAGVWRVKPKPENGEYIDLDDENVDIKTDVRYQYLGFSFTPRYSESNNKYFTTIQPINDDKDGSDKYYSWVIYGDSLEELEKSVRINIKTYKQKFNL